MIGKPELKLAYKTGAMFILDNVKEFIENDPGVKERLDSSLDHAFEEWYKTVSPLFALVSNEC